MSFLLEVILIDIVDRLFDLVDKKYNEQKDFAALLGVNPTLPSRWRNRKSTSYNKYLPQIAVVLGTTTEYLLTGKKEPAGQQADGKQEEFIQLYQQLTPQEQAFFLSQLRGYVKDRGTSSAPQE